MRISSWLNSGTKRNPIPAGGPTPTPALEDTWADALLEAYRSRAPGQFLTNKLALAQAMRGVAYLAINTLATQFAAAKPVLYQESDDEEHEDGKVRLSRLDPMYRLLKHPNPLDPWVEVAYQMSMQLDTTGTCLVWLPPGEDGHEPEELFVLPTATVTPLPRSFQFPDGAYRVMPYCNTAFYTVPGQSGAGAVIPASQVIQIKNNHPYLKWEGYAVLTAISRSVDTLNAIDQSRFQGMMQGCQQTVALEFDPAVKDPDEADLKRIRAEWQKIYEGAQGYGKLAILSPGGKLNKFATEPDKMAWQEGWTQLADFILAAYQVPKAVTGMSGDLTYATLYASLKQFYLMSLDPRLQKFGANLTHHWVQPTYGDEFLLEFEAKRIDDEQLTQAKIANAQKTGSLTHQELRRLNGWADLDAAKHPWVLERATAAAGPAADKTPEKPQDGSPDGREQDPAVESSRPDNGEGDGSLGPRKDFGRLVLDEGDRLAAALDRHKHAGTVFSTNGKH
ncbi:MAG: phage portal protein [Gemmataceae bacterium]